MSPVGATEPAVTLVLAAGTRLFEYRIDAVLGQGGFGITYLATDVHLNARVAIKEYLPADYAQRASDRSVSPRWPEHHGLYQDGLDNFLVEARTLATFRHPNIVRVARFFEANRTAYIVLEYERGEPLRLWWNARKGMAEAALLSLLQPLLNGLALVHATGFLHRDIKPDNIYVRKDDGSLVLLDFGAARATGGGPGAGADVVTPGYAPPEQYDGGAQGAWTDIYALGATLYWMVSGSKPPAAPARVDGSAVMVSALQAGEGRYSETFLRALDWALQCDPAARPQHVQAFAQALFAAHAGSMALHDALNADAAPNVDPDDDGLGAAMLPGAGRRLRATPRQLLRRLTTLARAALRPASWPMIAKMTVAMVVAAMAPMLITAYYNLNGSVKAVSAGELRNLERIAQSTAGRISQMISDSQHLGDYMATDDDVIDCLQHPAPTCQQAVSASLATLVRTNPDVHQMALLDADGRALAASLPAAVGEQFGVRDYVRAARQGRAFKTGIVVGPRDGERGMYYANPVLDAGGKVIGVVVLRIKAATFGSILDEVGVGTNRVPFMVDGQGQMIYHPDARHLEHTLTEATAPGQAGAAVATQAPSLARALRGASAPGHVSYRSPLTGVDEHAGYAPVRAHDWVVAVTESKVTFEAPLQKLFANVMASVLLVGLVFLVLAVLFGRSIVRPIARLTDAANALKEGDYERATIRVTSTDEIGRLARTFNVMIDVLRQREREQGRGGVPPPR